MAESSRSRVTITLGRGGQVVKRDGPVSDRGFSGSQPAAGSKRSIRDRLGTVADGYSMNKRQREDNSRLAANDSRLGENDLRYKLLQKNVIKQTQSSSYQKGLDLRQKLSRPAQDHKSDLGMGQRVPESMDSRTVLHQRRKDLSTVPVPPTRSTSILPRTEPQRSQQSPWTLEKLRDTSPDRVVTTSRTVSAPRRDEEIMKRPLMRSYDDDSRDISYMTRDVSESRRPFSSAPYMTKPTTAAPLLKSVVPSMSRPLPHSGSELKSAYRVDERHSLDSFLYSLGLEKYIIPFKAEEVDMATLRQMGERDLKELGIPMGPRKKILLALLPPRSKITL